MGTARLEQVSINIIQADPRARVELASVNVIYSEAAWWQAVLTTETSLIATLTYSPPGFGVTPRWTWPVAERLTFATEILQSHNRTEQRIALRQGVPTRAIGTRLLAEGDHAYAELEALLHGWLKRKARVPLWFEAERYDGSLAAGSSSIALDTRFAGYRDGAAAMIWTSKDLYEYVYIDSFTDSALTLYSQTLYAHQNPWIMPAKLGYAVMPCEIERVDGGALAQIVYEIEDVTAVSGFTAEMTYDGMTVLTEPAHWPGDAGTVTIDPDVELNREGCGPFDVVDNSTYNEAMQSHVWHPWTKAEAWWLRQFFHDVKGRQVAFLVPTFREDITLTRPVLSGSKILYVKNAGFGSNMNVNDMRTYLAFRPADSDIIVRKLTDISIESANEEKFTLDSAPGEDFKMGDSLCWADTCRLAEDAVEWIWHNIGKATVSAPLIRVPT